MDIEMTKKCAEAMGLADIAVNAGHVVIGVTPNRYVYQPLKDDAQAMALLKRFMLEVSFTQNPVERGASIAVWRTDWTHRVCGTDLNHAIVECVSKMVKP